METNKIIQLPTKPEATSTITKKIEKQVIKRQITTTPRWTFSQEDIHNQPQLIHLYDPLKKPFLYQQIKNKLSSYKSQDIEKNIYQPELVMDLSNVLQKLESSQGHCFYCKTTVFLLYDNVRDPRQWTLERLDNKKGHWFDNVEIACLSCNLRRRTMKYERYVLTKEIKNVVKMDDH